MGHVGMGVAMETYFGDKADCVETTNVELFH